MRQSISMILLGALLAAGIEAGSGAADNVGLLLKPDPAHFQALIAVPPSIDLGPMDTHGRFIPGKAVALVGIIIPQPKAICYHDRIDYA